MRYFFKAVSGLLALFVLQVKGNTIENYLQYLPDGTNVTFIAQKVTAAKTTIIDYRGGQMMSPASTLKVITALAAMLQLGPEYRFTTTLESHGKLQNGVLQGDLIARFSGDPTLKRQQLRAMVQALKQQGITQIQGDLIIDTSAFAGHDRGPGWPWNDMTQCFSAPPAAAIVDGNCFSISLVSGMQVGDLAFVRTASYYPVNVFSEVRTIAANSSEREFCELDVTPGELNRYTLSGCLPKRSEPLPLAFAVQNGASYTGAILKAEILQANIKITGHLKQQKFPTTPGVVLAQTQSAPLPDLLRTMLKKSDNMIADTLFRTIAREKFKIPGTWGAGAKAVRLILQQKAGINLGNSVIVDGSGLSRYNLIPAATMVQVLQYIAQHDQQLQLIDKLPLAGHDGTLQYRAGLTEAGVNGKVFAKTGSLAGVYNLAGFITAASGQRIAFVQFVASYSVLPQNYNQRRVPLARFESRLYKQLYQQN
ncbi:MAG: serine-type D-Ala-D-Ala carboxypeptidase [Enterobacteriaceae bacterium]